MKKQDIFNAALSLIATQGLHATPMSQIAKEANVAAGTIYHYFSSKEEMINELYLEIHAEFESEIKADEVDLDNYETEFSSLCLRVFKFLIQNPTKFYFLQQYDNSPFGIGVEAIDKYVDFPIYEAFFDLGLQNNYLTSIPASLMSNMVYSNLSSMARLQLLEKIELNREIIEQVINGCWNMIKK